MTERPLVPGLSAFGRLLKSVACPGEKPNPKPKPRGIRVFGFFGRRRQVERPGPLGGGGPGLRGRRAGRAEGLQRAAGGGAAQPGAAGLLQHDRLGGPGRWQGLPLASECC